jgi:hypothetical protein
LGSVEVRIGERFCSRSVDAYLVGALGEVKRLILLWTVSTELLRTPGVLPGDATAAATV